MGNWFVQLFLGIFGVMYCALRAGQTHGDLWVAAEIVSAGIFGAICLILFIAGAPTVRRSKP